MTGNDLNLIYGGAGFRTVVFLLFFWAFAFSKCLQSCESLVLVYVL